MINKRLLRHIYRRITKWTWVDYFLLGPFPGEVIHREGEVDNTGFLDIVVFVIAPWGLALWTVFGPYILQPNNDPRALIIQFLPSLLISALLLSHVFRLTAIVVFKWLSLIGQRVLIPVALKLWNKVPEGDQEKRKRKLVLHGESMELIQDEPSVDEYDQEDKRDYL